MNRLVSAEWLKLRTTRLLHGIGPATVAISVAAVAGSVLAADRSDVAYFDVPPNGGPISIIERHHGTGP